MFIFGTCGTIVAQIKYVAETFYRNDNIDIKKRLVHKEYNHKKYDLCSQVNNDFRQLFNMDWRIKMVSGAVVPAAVRLAVTVSAPSVPISDITHSGGTPMMPCQSSKRIAHLLPLPDLLSDGAIRLSDGSVELSDGSVQHIGWASLLTPDGAVVYPDGTLQQPNGPLLSSNLQPLVTPAPLSPLPAGAEQLLDGAVLLADGSVRLPSGNMLLARTQLPYPDIRELSGKPCESMGVDCVSKEVQDALNALGADGSKDTASEASDASGDDRDFAGDVLKLSGCGYEPERGGDFTA